MRVLVIKTSSLGDVIHTLPALTDAARVFDGIRFDWLVEESFAEVPGWHPAVDRVIPVAVRRWRKHPIQAWRSGEWQQCKKQLSEQTYDAVIDAQCLLKSAWFCRYVNGPSYGYDKTSAREPLASRFYDHPITVAKEQPAVERTRQLFALALGYPLPETRGTYGLDLCSGLNPLSNPEKQVLLLHGTTWASKHWPEAYWIELAKKLIGDGYRVMLPWGSSEERLRAEKIANITGADVLPKMSLTELAQALSSAAGCVSVDTGLGHLAAAVGVPTVSLFGATNASLTGFYGENQLPLQSEFACSPCMRRECRFEKSGEAYPPCYEQLPPERVLEKLAGMMAERVAV